MEPSVPEGYKVRYKHIRRLKFQPFTGRFDDFKRIGSTVSHQIDPLGGQTIAIIYLDEPRGDDGSIVPVEYARGVSKCHPGDNFNKKLGRRIALGRAVKDFEKHVLPSDLDVMNRIPGA